MKVLLNACNGALYDERAHLFKKKDSDETIVRKTLLHEWTRILENYARPGMVIPETEVVRKELLREGVDAAVSAIVDEHWFLFSFMIRDEIKKKVEKELSRFDLADFLEDVKLAQQDPAILNCLRKKIRRYVLEN